MFGGKVKSVDAAKVASMPGVKKVVQRRRHRGRGRRRHLVAREDRARRARHRMGRRAPNAQGLERDDRCNAEGRPRRASEAFVGNKAGDARPRSPARRSKIEAIYSYPVPESRDHGADERDGALDAERCEVWARRRTARRRSRRRRAQRACRSPSATSTSSSRRRLRPPRPSHDYVQPGGADREGDAGHAGQADLVARGGHDARALPPGHAVQADRRLSTPTAMSTGLHMRISGQSILRRLRPEAPRERQGSVSSRASTRRHRRLCSATTSLTCYRPRDAQPAMPAGLLARREHQPERDLSSSASSTSSRMRPGRTRSSSAAS